MEECRTLLEVKSVSRSDERAREGKALEVMIKCLDFNAEKDGGN